MHPLLPVSMTRKVLNTKCCCVSKRGGIVSNTGIADIVRVWTMHTWTIWREDFLGAKLLASTPPTGDIDENCVVNLKLTNGTSHLAKS